MRAWPVLALACAACSSTRSAPPEFSGRDGGVTIGAARFAYTLMEEPDWRARAETTWTETDGAFDATRFTLAERAFGVAVEQTFDEPLTFEARAGLAGLDVFAESQGVVVERDASGVYVGVGGRWDVHDPLAIYARSTLFAGSHSMNSMRNELGLDVALFGPLHAFAAYGYWRAGRETFTISPFDLLGDVNLRASGLLVGVGLSF